MVESATPGIFYHGSPVRGLTELKSAAELKVRNKNHGIYCSPSRAYAEMHSGSHGVVYELRLHTDEIMEAEYFSDMEYVTAAKFTFYRSLGVDCLWHPFLGGEMAVLNSSVIEIVRTTPTTTQEVWAAIAALEALVHSNPRTAADEKSLTAMGLGPPPPLKTQLVSKRNGS